VNISASLVTQILSIASSADGKRLRVERIPRGKHTAVVELDAATLEVLGTKPPAAGWLPVASVATSLKTRTRGWVIGEFGAGLFLRTLRGAPVKAPAPFNDPALTVTAFAISADDRWALVGSASGFVSLLDTVSGDEPWGERVHRGHVTAAAFSPDGKRAFTGSAGGVLCVHLLPARPAKRRSPARG